MEILMPFISDFIEYITNDPVIINVGITITILFALRLYMSFISPKPAKGFQRVAGMQQLKEQIRQEILIPFYNADKYKKFHLSLPNGVLFYGPTGCGKTYFVECLAEELNMNYIKVTHADLASPYIHDTVSKISSTFQKALAQAPCLVFFDEIEGLVPSRTTVSNSAFYKHEEVDEFLLHLDNASRNGLLIVGATNHLDMIDIAVQRSGRFDLKIYIAPPDDAARQELFANALKNIPHASIIDYQHLASLTENYTCADIINIVKSAARYAVAHNANVITNKMLINSIKEHPSSLKKDELIP